MALFHFLEEKNVSIEMCTYVQGRLCVYCLKINKLKYLYGQPFIFNSLVSQFGLLHLVTRAQQFL